MCCARSADGDARGLLTWLPLGHVQHQHAVLVPGLDLQQAAARAGEAAAFPKGGEKLARSPLSSCSLPASEMQEQSSRFARSGIHKLGWAALPNKFLDMHASQHPSAQ